MSDPVSKTTGRPSIEWIWAFDRLALFRKNPAKEVFYLIRHGSWCWGRNRDGWLIGAGRMYYDGPHWFFHFGPLGVSLSAWRKQ